MRSDITLPLLPLIPSRILLFPFFFLPALTRVGLIIGPRGNTQKDIERKWRVKIAIRGRGSCKCSDTHAGQEPLHVRITTYHREGMLGAIEEVSKLLVPIPEPLEKHKCGGFNRLLESYITSPQSVPVASLTPTPAIQQPTSETLFSDYEEFMRAISTPSDTSNQQYQQSSASTPVPTSQHLQFAPPPWHGMTNSATTTTHATPTTLGMPPPAGASSQDNARTEEQDSPTTQKKRKEPESP